MVFLAVFSIGLKTGLMEGPIKQYLSEKVSAHGWNSFEVYTIVLVSLSFFTTSKMLFTGYPFSCNFYISLLILGMENSILNNFMTGCCHFFYQPQCWIRVSMRRNTKPCYFHRLSFLLYLSFSYFFAIFLDKFSLIYDDTKS